MPTSNEESKRVDILFVVPDSKWDTWRRAIKHTLWAIESDKTYEVVSADTFVRLYKDMSGAEINAALKDRCVVMTNTDDISKREWKEFQPLRQRLYDHWAENTQQEVASANIE